MRANMVVAACLSRGDLAHGCCLDLGWMALPWLLPYEGYHGLGNMHVGMPWPWQHAHMG